MKLDRNFIIPLAIMLTVCFFALFYYPVFFVMSMLLIGVIIIVLSQKFNHDWGIMFFWGIIISVIFVALLLGIFKLGLHYEWIRNVVLWPYN